MEAAHLPINQAEVVELRPRLGSILLRHGLVTPQQLEEALEEKAETGDRLGDIVVRRGWVWEGALAWALAVQFGCDYHDLAATPPDPALASMLSEQLARRCLAVPVKFVDDETLLVAVADPTNVMISDDLRMALGQSFQIAVSTASDIEKALTRLYGVGGPEADVEVFPSGGRRAEAIDLNAAAASAPVIGRVNGVIRKAIEEGASDIHFEPQAHGLVVRARVDGVMRHLDTIPIEMQQAVVSRLKIMGELDIAERRAPQDGRVSITFGRTPMDLRMAVLPSTYGEQVVLRIIYLKGSRSLELSSLGMSEQAAQVFLDAISQPSGAIITCGPTGSGKTTTLYAGLSLLNQEDRVLMTIEDPVELQLDGVNQIEVNVRAGLTFTRGLRTILRSDPDILLVGEIRDEETARIAVQASMTGHLVLTTLHALDAASSIARLKDMGVPPSLLAASVNCVVAQRLARRLCQQCRQPYDLPVSKLAEAGFREELLPDGASVTLYRPGTCVECEGGYIGRVGLYEIMQLNSEIRDRIDASTDAISAAALANGMQTIREDGLRLSLEGHTSLDEVRRVSGDWMP